MEVSKDTKAGSLETWEGNIGDFPLDGDRLRIQITNKGDHEKGYLAPHKGISQSATDEKEMNPIDWEVTHRFWSRRPVLIENLLTELKFPHCSWHLRSFVTVRLLISKQCKRGPVFFRGSVYFKHIRESWLMSERVCGLVVRVPGYRYRNPGSIPGATRFSENQWVWNGHSASWVQLRIYLKENVAAPV
jgi:hypothetical protein